MAQPLDRRVLGIGAVAILLQSAVMLTAVYFKDQSTAERAFGDAQEASRKENAALYVRQELWQQGVDTQRQVNESTQLALRQANEATQATQREMTAALGLVRESISKLEVAVTKVDGKTDVGNARLDALSNSVDTLTRRVENFDGGK